MKRFFSLVTTVVLSALILLGTPIAIHSTAETSSSSSNSTSSTKSNPDDKPECPTPSVDAVTPQDETLHDIQNKMFRYFSASVRIICKSSSYPMTLQM